MHFPKSLKNLIFNNRKGLSHEIFFNAFELVLAVIIAIALFLFISDIAEQTIFEKNYLVRDLALVINTLYAAPEEIVYNYEEDTSKFILDFTENKVTVFRKEEEKTNTNIFYLFAENKNTPFRYKTISIDEKDNKIGFFKLDKYLDVGKADLLNIDSSSEITDITESSNDNPNE